jgi:RecB family endonuclease NucS
MEHRQHVVTASKARAVGAKLSLNLQVALERYLEDLLIQDWDCLPWAIELEYLDRQVECGTLGRIDILARDRNTGDYVVIELKRDQSDDEVIGQCSRYMGWIKQYWAEPADVGVRGVIVAHDATDRLQAAVLPHGNISLYAYQFSVVLTPVATEMAITR